MRHIVWGLLCALAACGSKNTGTMDAPPPIDAAVDAAVDAPTDGPAPDAPPAAATGDVRELSPAAGRMTGGGMTLDVQLGHPIPQNPTNGGGRTLEGGAAIKP